MNVRMYVCMYVFEYMYVCMYACMHACMHVCMYVCMYVCISISAVSDDSESWKAANAHELAKELARLVLGGVLGRFWGAHRVAVLRAFRVLGYAMEPMELVAVHGSNKCPKYLNAIDPLGNFVRAAVEQQLYLSMWIRQSHRVQMALRRRCDKRWDGASAFEILYESWLLLRNPDRLVVLRSISWFDPKFCSSMLCVLCLRQDPGLDSMD